MERLKTKISACTKCPIAKYSEHKIFWRTHKGLKKERLLFVGEAPGRTEHLLQLPFTGRAGDILDELLDLSGANDYSYLITNSIHCTPFLDDTCYEIGTPDKTEINNCRPWVEKVIALWQPSVIFALGSIAKTSLKDHPHVVMYHPIFIARQADNYQLEFKRALLTIEEALERFQD